jgi:hypothetical protein
MPSEELRAIELLGRVRYGLLATGVRAMPALAHARHVVADGRVLRAGCGSVVAYGADTLSSGSAALWSVHFTGTAQTVRPTDEEPARFGPRPHRIDGEDFRPAYLCVEPHFATVHTMGDSEGHSARHTE